MTAIRVQNLGKEYHIGGRGPYETLREKLTRLGAAPFRAVSRLLRSDVKGQADARNGELFWALKDVSFDVQPGEVVGVIGRNGAGKSTLLKILARITEPTTGTVELNGRVASLLEIGTGFHSELTGRENIFLNGAILGMTRGEIRKKFDEIVGFAEVERFIDTQVKHYSSGMYMRLAFAVAAHLEPEILIVDEVLAVGDADFQKKCLGKMEDVAQRGRTVLFVSHNMPAMQRLCQWTLWLNKGMVNRSGPTEEVIGLYYAESQVQTMQYTAPPGVEQEQPYFQAAWFENSAGKKISHVVSSDDLFLCLAWRVPERTPGLRIGMGLNNAFGVRVFGSNPEDASGKVSPEAGEYVGRLRIPKNTLLPIQYTLDLHLWAYKASFDWLRPAFQFRPEAGVSPVLAADPHREGLIQFYSEWNISAESYGG